MPLETGTHFPFIWGWQKVFSPSDPYYLSSSNFHPGIPFCSLFYCFYFHRCVWYIWLLIVCLYICIFSVFKCILYISNFYNHDDDHYCEAPLRCAPFKTCLALKRGMTWPGCSSCAWWWSFRRRTPTPTWRSRKSRGPRRAPTCGCTRCPSPLCRTTRWRDCCWRPPPSTPPPRPCLAPRRSVWCQPDPPWVCRRLDIERGPTENPQRVLLCSMFQMCPQILPIS